MLWLILIPLRAFQILVASHLTMLPPNMTLISFLPVGAVVIPWLKAGSLRGYTRGDYSHIDFKSLEEKGWLATDKNGSSLIWRCGLMSKTYTPSRAC
jgi:hypothetical protein